MANICVIGAGNIGSRHLQALAKNSEELLIQVIDPSADSLLTAKTRYEEIDKGKSKNQVVYLQDLNKIEGPLDIAIIATTSNIRYAIARQLLDKVPVKYIIFEKILFDQSEQYGKMAEFLAQKKCRAWVNCPRRMIPFYKSLKDSVRNTKIQYAVSGSQWGLACNTIHYIDHLSYLTDCYDFEVITDHLDTAIIESRRKGFLELTGTLFVYFKDGSFSSLACYPAGNAPSVVQISSDRYRSLTLETEGKSYISTPASNWQWKLKETPMLYQSSMTNLVVSALVKDGSCDLTPFDLSAKLHLQLLKPLLEFVNMHSKTKYKNFPFT
jgi:predicted dehydrogenase